MDKINIYDFAERTFVLTQSSSDMELSRRVLDDLSPRRVFFGNPLAYLDALRKEYDKRIQARFAGSQDPCVMGR